jgi:hypothetical protein
VHRWQDVITWRRPGPETATRRQACKIRHRTFMGAYSCGARKLRTRAASGARFGTQANGRAYALLALEVRPAREEG